MGLTLENIKYKDLLNDISYRFSRRRITGIYGDNADVLVDIINGDNNDYDGNVIFEKSLIDNNFYKNNPTLVATIDPNPFFYTNRVEDECKFNLDFRKYRADDVKNKITSLLNLLGLDEEILKRDINTLSRSEKYLLTIVINLIYDPEIIIFRNIFDGLDHNSRKKLITLINNLREDKKIILITSRDTNILYELTDEVVLLSGNTIYKSGATDKLFTSIELIRENVIPMPNIIKVSYLARTDKKVKLSYHKDVRDIIKDIYKHV